MQSRYEKCKEQGGGKRAMKSEKDGIYAWEEEFKKCATSTQHSRDLPLLQRDVRRKA